MEIRQSTAAYEKWLGNRLVLIPADLELKHQRMAESPFPFLRATFYRWVQRWPAVCPDLAAAPTVLSVGDLHVENFGTWRDVEGRLIWGINDFDEAYPMPYTNDLVRLAASVLLAAKDDHLGIASTDACDAILKGYEEGLAGGDPFVLAESHRGLRDMATSNLRDPAAFWEKLEKLPVLRDIPPAVTEALQRWLPEQGLRYNVVHRIAGLGSLGRQRFVALADWRGGKVAREAKALAESACLWERGPSASAEILYEKTIRSIVRVPDPWVQLCGKWIVRRLAPDCSRIELASLPKDRDELKLLRAMGQETAHVHLGDRRATAAIRSDLERRPAKWLREAAEEMADATEDDWKQWKKTEEITSKQSS
jgi:hypothetical protein